MVASWYRQNLLGLLWLMTGMLVPGLVSGMVVLPAGYDSYSLNAYASYLIDPAGEMDAQQALKSTEWQLNAAGDVLNFGFTGEAVWIRTEITVPPRQHGAWHLVIPYPLLERADLFLVREGGIEALPQAGRAGGVESHHLHFVLPSLPDAPVQLLLRVRSFTSLQVPLELWSNHYLVNRQNAETMVWGLYFGVLLALMGYNLFLFVSMRDSAYLFYVLYMGSLSMLMFCISGYGTLYLWESVGVVRYVMPISTGMTTLWSILFALAFLRGCGINPLLNKVLRAGALLSLFLMLFALTGSDSGAVASGMMAMFGLCAIILAGLNALASGAAIARYFILAWMMFAAGSMIYLFNVFNLIPVSQFTNHAIQAGSALEALLLSLALAHRIKEERRQKEFALEQKSMAEQRMKQAQALALERALHDSLTQRPNDALLLQRVQELIRNQGAVDAFALVLFYCPQMNEVSSSLGRRLAEEAFCAVVEDVNRQMALDRQNILIEFETDSYVAVTEFGSLVALTTMSTDMASLQEYAQHYISFFGRSIDIDEVVLDLEVVCGIACYPKQGDRADLLLQHAAAARDFGLRTRESVTIYSSEIEAFSRRRLKLIGGLKQAICDGELALYLQPQVESSTLKLTGAEVLLRWNSKYFGSVPPVEFIEVAEQAGLMDMLTRYVVDGAFALLNGFRRSGLDITISINLSIQNLIEPGIVSWLTASATRAGINLSDVVLEVTETSKSENMNQVIDSLRQLAATGCYIALDDFGTGYSSLSYLSSLPVHELKVDRSFIARMNQSESDFRIVDNTVKLARALQIQTVAEGVEDEVTLSRITQMGCDRVQGYFIARPMPVDQFRDWVMRHELQLRERAASQSRN